MGSTGFVVVYRVRLRPGAEASYAAAWARLTELIREHAGGRGSRLHRGADGVWYAYAQWPDRAAWERPRDLTAEADDLVATMAAAVLEGLAPLELEVELDLLLPEP